MKQLSANNPIKKLFRHYRPIKRMASTILKRISNSRKNAAKSKIKSIYSKLKGKDFIEETCEEEFINNSYYNKKCIAELINAVLSLICILLAVYEYELFFDEFDVLLNQDTEESIEKIMNNKVSNALLWACTISTFLLIINVWFTEIIYLDHEIELRVMSKTETLITSSRVYRLIVISILLLVHPNMYTKTMIYTPYNRTYDFKYNMSINNIFCIIMFFRYFYIYRFFLVRCTFMKPEVNRICKQNKFNSNYMFTLKALLKNNPALVYLITVVLSIYSYMFSVRVLERKLEVKTGVSFGSVWNSIWYVIITMMTVGYGDLVTLTTEGRIIAVFACITGVFLTSMMFISINNILDMSPTEQRIYDIMDICRLNEKIKKSSEKIITDVTDVIVFSKRGKPNETYTTKRRPKFNTINMKSPKKISLIKNLNTKKNEVGNAGTFFSHLKPQDINEKANQDKQNLSLRECVELENFKFRKLKKNIKEFNEAVNFKNHQERFTPYTRSIENISILVKQYSSLEAKQNKLLVEVFDIKKRIEKVLSKLNSHC